VKLKIDFFISLTFSNLDINSLNLSSMQGISSYDQLLPNSRAFTYSTVSVHTVNITLMNLLLVMQCPHCLAYKKAANYRSHTIHRTSNGRVHSTKNWARFVTNH